MDEDFHVFGGVIVDLPDFDFALIVGEKDRVDHGGSGFAEWDLVDDQCFLVELVDSGPDSDFTTTLTVVVS